MGISWYFLRLEGVEVTFESVEFLVGDDPPVELFLAVDLVLESLDLAGEGLMLLVAGDEGFEGFLFTGGQWEEKSKEGQVKFFQIKGCGERTWT